MPRPPGAPPAADAAAGGVPVTAGRRERATRTFRGRVPDVAAGVVLHCRRRAAPRVYRHASFFDAPAWGDAAGLSVEGASAGVIDTEIRDIVVPDPDEEQTTLKQPVVYRARTPRELQQMKATRRRFRDAAGSSAGPIGSSSAWPRTAPAGPSSPGIC